MSSVVIVIMMLLSYLSLNKPRWLPQRSVDYSGMYLVLIYYLRREGYVIGVVHYSVCS